MTHGAQVAMLSLIPAHLWKNAAIRMAWYYRTGDPAHVPDNVRAAFGSALPDHKTWAEVRKATNRARKIASTITNRGVDLKTVKRRDYMRKYMGAYRKGAHKGTS